MKMISSSSSSSSSPSSNHHHNNNFDPSCRSLFLQRHRRLSTNMIVDHNFSTKNNKMMMMSLSSSRKTANFLLISVVCLLVEIINIRGVIACYFPIEYQGTFLIQTQGIGGLQLQNEVNNNSSLVTYSEVTIEADAIPPWGRCHKRRGNNVILKDSTGAGQDCLRCFHLSMKTPNVIALHTDGLERCYTNEDAARAKCPLDKDIQQNKKFREIILFRKHVPGGLQSIEHVFCPFNGRFRFTYIGGTYQSNSNQQHGHSANHQPPMRCDYGYSEMSNCPHGNALNVKFRKCSFATMDIHFLCLGDWESSNNNPTTVNSNNERYLALMDLRETPEANRPKYRCGLYKEDHLTGQIHISLSSDSTCSTNLHNSSSGFDSLILSPIPAKRVPPLVESSKCRFPDWMQGRWQRTKVENQQFIYKDEHNQFRTIRSRCVMRQSDIANDRFVVHSITQCGEQSYSCLWVKRRSPNIMEFKYSDSQSAMMNEKLCDERNFATSQWITEGKEKIVAQSTPCPITGDYTGEVPGASGLCAKVASDCNNPDIMFYSVSSCENRSHVYEEREYRCLGNWEEDGVLYTFTQRRDMPGHQCFAGKVYRNGDEAYIKEAGESCMRGEDEDPLIFGMKISKQASCPRHIVKPMVPPPPPPPLMPPSPPIHHQPPTNRFSYPPLIKPLMPTISPSMASPPIPPIIPAQAPPSVIFNHHHSSFKPIHVDRTQSINNPNQPASPSQHPIYPPFWSYEPTDIQPTTKTHYKPIISDRDKTNHRDIGSFGSRVETWRITLLFTVMATMMNTLICYGNYFR